MSFFSTLKNLNRNVQLVFTYSFLQSLGRGIWLGNVLSAYIYFIAGSSNITLGWTSAATGIAFSVMLLPSGYLSDNYRRDIMLKVASIFGLIAIVLLALSNTLTLIFVSLVFWGLAQGISRPSLEALFADSVPSGSRSGIYSKLHLVRNGAFSVGPFINILLFVLLGDKWEIGILKTVMFAGLGISLISLLTLQLFSDDEALDDISEAIEEVEDNQTVVPKISKRRQYIPLILVISNLLIGMGAGMTIKFFPIFFIDIYNLQPIAVNAILGTTAIATGLAAIVAQKASLKRGRVIIIVTVQIIATICLFLLALYPAIFLLVPIFIARGSLMNASQPLSRSILMDYVPKKNRGKWNSIEALAWGMFWNASAVAGGYLIDIISFSMAFTVTGVIYILGTLPLLTLIPLVRSETPISELELNKEDEADAIEGSSETVVSDAEEVIVESD